jgi:hypothetical protein
MEGYSLQWANNVRLRTGIWLVVGLCWVYGLLVISDWTAAREVELSAYRDEMQTLEPVARSASQWAGREKELVEATDRLRALSWPGSERGIIEATVQDWLRAATTKAGLSLREIRILSELGPSIPVSGSRPIRPAALEQRLPEPIRLRVVMEFRRQEAMAWLVEWGRQEPLIVVDRLVIRTQTQPAVLEAELRVLGLEGRVSQ